MCTGHGTQRCKTTRSGYKVLQSLVGRLDSGRWRGFWGCYSGFLLPPQLLLPHQLLERLRTARSDHEIRPNGWLRRLLRLLRGCRPAQQGSGGYGVHRVTSGAKD
jgi:hypothetical protein